MHTFDALWKLGHPTPYREQKKTSPKKRREKENKKRSQMDWWELFIEILVFSIGTNYVGLAWHHVYLLIHNQKKNSKSP